MELKESFSKLDIFENLSDDEIDQITSYFVLKQFKQDDVIYNEGDSGRELGIILSGQVKVSINDGEKLVDLNMLSEGDVFGELSLMDEQPRSATIIAYEDCEIAFLEHKSLQTMMTENSNISSKFLYQLVTMLAKRFRNIDLKVKLTLWKKDKFF